MWEAFWEKGRKRSDGQAGDSKIAVVFTKGSDDHEAGMHLCSCSLKTWIKVMLSSCLKIRVTGVPSIPGL